MSSNLKACAFCGADKQHFRVNPKTTRRDRGMKGYEIETLNDDSTMVVLDLDVMECLKCKRKWMRYKEIERAISENI